MRAPSTWVGQTDDGIYDVTVARHQTFRSHIHSAVHIQLSMPDLTFISKVIERVAARRLNDYLAEHSLLPRC